MDENRKRADCHHRHRAVPHVCAGFEIQHQDRLRRQRALKLLSFQTADGGIYKSLLANYNTAIAVSTLVAANDPAMKPQVDKAVDYLKRLQWTEETRPEYANEKEQNTGKQVVKDNNDPFYGGWGYGGRSPRRPPDISNTHMAIEAAQRCRPAGE